MCFFFSSLLSLFVFRLETLIKVVKSAGNLVGSHLAPLMSALLEATQVAEGQSLNYLSVRLGNQVATQEKLDLARISAAKSSNLYETVQHVSTHRGAVQLIIFVNITIKSIIS